MVQMSKESQLEFWSGSSYLISGEYVSDSTFAVSVDKYYGKQQDDDQKLAFVGEVGNL